MVYNYSKYNGTVYYYVTNLQSDVVQIVDASGNSVASYEYDPYGKVISATGTLAEVNPIRYRGYYYDNELGLYYLQSRYYDPTVGRFLNADSYASTGLGFLGHNMFAYCNNSPAAYSDSSGQRMVYVRDFGGGPVDYVIYYHHPKSNKNLDEPAKQNHSDTDSFFTAVGSFDELVTAINNTPGCVDDVFIYLHGDANDLSFYHDLNYSAECIQNSFIEIKIYGDIYLFSCKGGRGTLASTMASVTNCDVIACEYKVSYGDGFARCGRQNYIEDFAYYGVCGWYRFSPNGSKAPVSCFRIYTQ